MSKQTPFTLERLPLVPTTTIRADEDDKSESEGSLESSNDLICSVLVSSQWSRVNLTWSRPLPFSLLSWSQQSPLNGCLVRDHTSQTINEDP